MAVPVPPPRGTRPAGRLSGAQRLVALAWVQFVLTIFGVVSTIWLIRTLIELGHGMACFDASELACADPVAWSDQWRSLVAGAALIAVAAAALVVAYRHGRGRARGSTTVGVLSVSAALNCLAAFVLLSL